MQNELRGKVALMTGAARGIGANLNLFVATTSFAAIAALWLGGILGL